MNSVFVLVLHDLTSGLSLLYIHLMYSVILSHFRTLTNRFRRELVAIIAITIITGDHWRQFCSLVGYFYEFIAATLSSLQKLVNSFSSASFSTVDSVSEVSEDENIAMRRTLPP